MKVNLFKKASLFSLGFLCFFASCDKNEGNDFKSSEDESLAQSKMEFNALIDEISKDTDLIDIQVIDFNEELKSHSDGFATDAGRAGTLYLYALKGVYGTVGASKDHSCTDEVNGGSTYYRKLPIDLNEGAGGHYAYLLYSLTSNKKNAIGCIDGYTAFSFNPKIKRAVPLPKK